MRICHSFFISGLVTLLTVPILLASQTVYGQKHSRKVTKPTDFQGICGTVVMKSGNFMPSPNRPAPTGKHVEREVLIFLLLNLSQVDAGENGFINSVREARPIKTVKSDKYGKFCVSLPVGHYSVLVQEPRGLYANLSDTQNNIFPVNVQKNRQSDIKIEISHQAVF